MFTSPCKLLPPLNTLFSCQQFSQVPLSLCVFRMKGPLGFRLPNPAPAPTLSNCCHKRKECLPKIWSLQPLKMVLSTRNPVTALPWIPGKGCALARTHGLCSLILPFPEFPHLGNGWPPGHLLPSCVHRQELSGAADPCLLSFLPFAGLPGSAFQVQAPAGGSLGRVYPGSRGSEKHSPDSACSVDYSSSRLSSPEHPNEGKAAP